MSCVHGSGVCVCILCTLEHVSGVDVYNVHCLSALVSWAPVGVLHAGCLNDNW